VTWMRDQCENDADMKSVLKSAAHSMKHREATSGSDVYDKRTSRASGWYAGRSHAHHLVPTITTSFPFRHTRASHAG
jgi:hypothetical protein